MSQETEESSLVEEITQVLELKCDHAWWMVENPNLAWCKQQWGDNRLVAELEKTALGIREGRFAATGARTAVMLAQTAARTGRSLLEEDSQRVYTIRCEFGSTGNPAWLATIEPTPETLTKTVTGDALPQVIDRVTRIIDDPEAVIVVDVHLPGLAHTRLLFIREIHSHYQEMHQLLTNQSQEMWAELRTEGMSDEDIETALKYLNGQC